MIPLVDDFLQMFIVSKLRFLKENPVLIDMIFQTGRRESLKKLKEFITSQKLRVVIGYPREQSSLPCYVITLAPESEQPSGLGDNSYTYGQLGIGDDVEEEAYNHIDDFVASTMMNSNYRIECWSDNGDLTAYMFTILKWCLWTSRKEMLSVGWNNIKLEGTDLEPVPDYMPVFIYRRAAQINLTYDALYLEDLEKLKKYLDIVSDPEKYGKDDENNIIDKSTGQVIIPAHQTWIINAYYFSKGSDDPAILTSSYKFESSFNNGITKIDKLPTVGALNVLYLVHQYLKGDYEYYKPLVWSVNLSKFVPPNFDNLTKTKYNDIIIVNSETTKEG